MIGTDIFVFPGFAAGRAGPAATGSFAIGAVVALFIGRRADGKVSLDEPTVPVGDEV